MKNFFNKISEKTEKLKNSVVNSVCLFKLIVFILILD